MLDSSSERFEMQDIGKDTVPKGSSSGDEPLIEPFGPRKSVSQDSNTSQNNNAFQGSNASQKLSQQSQQGPPATDPKKLSQVRVDELQRTRTDELPYACTDESKEERDHKSSQRQKMVESTLISKFNDIKEYIHQAIKKSKLDEEKKKSLNFFRNLNKLALFAYETEEGANMLESGQNPFLEEVDRLLEEIDGGTEPLSAEVDRLLEEIDSGTEPLLAKYEDLKRLNHLKKKKKSTDSSDFSLQERRKNKETLDT